jgi:hypothetical protein
MFRLLLLTAFAVQALSGNRGCSLSGNPRMVNKANLGLTIVAESGNICQKGARKASDNDKVIVQYESCSGDGTIFDIAPHSLPAIVKIGAETNINGTNLHHPPPLYSLNVLICWCCSYRQPLRVQLWHGWYV